MAQGPHSGIEMGTLIPAIMNKGYLLIIVGIKQLWQVIPSNILQLSRSQKENGSQGKTISSLPDTGSKPIHPGHPRVLRHFEACAFARPSAIVPPVIILSPLGTMLQPSVIIFSADVKSAAVFPFLAIMSIIILFPAFGL
jgi:hypothetical protein